MIRRKLTRIELQLDDTKEIDELLVKPPLLTNQPQQAQQNINVKHSTFAIDKNQQVGMDTELPSISDQQNTSAEHERIAAYNPQPYQGSNNRFQFNQSGQQLR